MATDTAEQLHAPTIVPGRPSWVIFARTTRGATRSGLLWGYVFGAFIASSAWSYSSVYRTQSQRDNLAATFGDNKATVALFGPAPDLQTVGGFTVLKVSMTLMIVGAIWGLLTSTRLLRGEEDAGRWDMFLSGGTTRGGAALQGLGGLAVSALVLWILTSLITSVAGVSSKVDIAPGPAMFLALALVSPALMFLAVGALTSQLAPTRRQAAGYGAVVLGVSYGLRMVGDGGIRLHWLSWLSPLGWSEMLAPLTQSNPWPLLLISGFTVVVGVAAVGLAATRDVGSSIFPDRPERVPNLRLLDSALGLSIRLMRTVAMAWLAALAVFGLLFGLVAKGAGATLSGSSLRETFDKLGAHGGGVGAYLGVTFLIVGVLIAFVAAGQIGAARNEESEGRLDHLVVRPLSRVRWLTGRLCLTLVLLVTAGFVAGLFTWLGAATQHSNVTVASVLGAGLNAATPAVLCLGLGALLLGFWPRAATTGIYAVVAWSLLVELVGGIGAISHWVLDTSVFSHVASAPAVPPNWSANAVLAGMGLLAAVAGLLGFRHRDLAKA
jgi:polyether ionophore transport system permease protein